MKRISAILIVVTIIASFIFYKTSRFDIRDSNRKEWMQTIPPLAQKLDASTDSFLKTHKLTEIDLVDFRERGKNLYVRFDNTYNFTYSNGVLFINETKYSDTAAALILIDAIAKHNMRHPVDRAAHLTNVLLNITDTFFNDAIKQESDYVRHLTKYTPMDSANHKKVFSYFDNNMGISLSSQESYFRMYLFHLAGAFMMCDNSPLNEDQKINCKTYYYNELQTWFGL